MEEAPVYGCQYSGRFLDALCMKILNKQDIGFPFTEDILGHSMTHFQVFQDL